MKKVVGKEEWNNIAMIKKRKRRIRSLRRETKEEGLRRKVERKE